MLERIPEAQFMSSGEQYCESAAQGRPLVTLWPLLAQVHRTVSPTEMLTVSGTNWKPFPPPTVTSKIVPVAMARRSRLAGHFDRECGWAARFLCRAYLSACRQIQLAP